MLQHFCDAILHIKETIENRQSLEEFQAFALGFGCWDESGKGQIYQGKMNLPFLLWEKT